MEKVVIVGGGISGIIAAIKAKNNNEVIILERNNTCGKKILVTGNGKCNYTNSNQDLSNYHSSNPELIEKIINEFNLNEMHDMLKNFGIIPKIKNGYYYPYSNQAVTFKNALLQELENKDIIVKTDTYVTNIEYLENKFIIETNKEKIIADKVVLATGGSASPKLGSDGNGYLLLKKLGHSIIEPLPALVGLKTKENISLISGCRNDVKLKLYENNKFIKEEIGEIQFNDNGISGICTMQLSSIIARGLFDNKKEVIFINFVPTIGNTKEEILNFINNQDKIVLNRNISELLDNMLNYKITNYLLKKLKLDSNLKWSNLKQIEKENIVDNLINFKLEIIDTNSFINAQTTSGGVPLVELDLKTMESLKIKNLYVIGELVDVDGVCGGYNITFALITGLLAGKNIGDNNA